MDSGTFNDRIGTGVQVSVGKFIVIYGDGFVVQSSCLPLPELSRNAPPSAQFICGLTRASAMASKKSALLPYFCLNVGLLKW